MWLTREVRAFTTKGSSAVGQQTACVSTTKTLNTFISIALLATDITRLVEYNP